VSFLGAESALRDTTVDAVGIGEHFGFARWPGATPNEGWQLNLAGAVSTKAAFEFRPTRDTARTGHYWRLMAEYYNRPSPYGQFFTEDIRYWGVGITLSL